MTRLARAPERTHRLIPSRFPPMAAFETVAAPEDLDPVFELEGWTHDRLVAPRLRRLARSDWVYGRPNASVVMAAFLHGAPQGSRFAGPDLGAWYAASALETAVLELVNRIRREIALSALQQKTEELREYTAHLEGEFVGIRGARPDLHDPDPATYSAAQVFAGPSGPALMTGSSMTACGTRVESTGFPTGRPGSSTCSRPDISGSSSPAPGMSSWSSWGCPERSRTAPATRRS